MSFQIIATILFSFFVLTGCSATNGPSASSDKFPGFTQVSTKATGSQFYVDESSIKAMFDQPTTFKMLQVLSDGYAIQDALVEENHLTSGDGVRYKSDGSVSGKFPGISVILDAGKQNGLLEVVNFVNKTVSKKRAIAGTFEDAKALQILYGDYRPDLNGSMRTNVPMPDGTVAANAVSRVFLSVPFEKGNQKQRLLLLQTNSEENSCHACAPLVSAAIFQEQDHTWQFLSSFATVPLSGHDGKPAECQWQKIGDENFGLVSKSSDMVQGNYLSQINIIALDGTTAIQILDSESESEHEQAVSSVNFEKSKEKYWKARVTFNYPGNKADNKVFNYVYDNGHYDEVTPLVPGTTDDAPDSSTSTNDESDAATPLLIPHKPPVPSPHKVSSNKRKPAPTHAEKRHKEIVPNGELDPKLFLDH